MDLTLETLEDWFALDGIHIIETRTLPPRTLAAYDRAAHTVYIRAGLPAYQRLPALLHEWHHHKRGDSGHCGPKVEAQINRAVAQALITPEAYARAEALAGGNSGAIAVELGLPKWVVAVYRSQFWAGARHAPTGCL